MTQVDFRAVSDLSSCLLGRFPRNLDWDSTVALANQTMTIASLATAVKASPEAKDVPGDIRDYLEVIHSHNAKRNRMLRDQLDQAVSCLNGAGIEPAVMKGAAILLTPGCDFEGRILTDLDLLVRPEKMHEAIRALRSIGYGVRVDGGTGSWPGDPRAHLPTVLDRPSDAGSIDLQCRPKGPASFGNIEWLYENSTRTRLGESYVHVPSQCAQIVYLILHDQFQDGDYWRGLIDLRHLLDMFHLSTSDAVVDWTLIRRLFAPGYERHATDTQILTMHALFGIPKVLAAGTGLFPRLQFHRRKLQLSSGYLKPLFTVATFLSEIIHCRSWDRYGGLPHVSRRKKLKHLFREFRRVFRKKQLGKV